MLGSDLPSKDEDADAQSEPKIHYCDAVYDLLQRISLVGVEGVPAPTEGALSFIEMFVGGASAYANIEPLLRSEIERQDASGSLSRWLRSIPHRLFDQTAYDMGCIDIDRADTRDDAIRLFLAHFGYVEGLDRKRPEGIWSAWETIEDAKRKLNECTNDNIDSVIGHGARIARAIESTLQILILFYGQFSIPAVFREYVTRKESLVASKEALDEWWKECQSKLPTKQLKDVYTFLVQQRTQIELSLRVLKELEIQIHTEETRKLFVSSFARVSILPPFDPAKLSPRTSSEHHGEFANQLEIIKDLRNRLVHSDPYVPEGTVNSDASQMLSLCRTLAEVSSFFFEAGKKHSLFPEVVLVRGKNQSIHRRWRVYATDERGNEFSFPLTKAQVNEFIPGNEMFCWWPESTSSGGPCVAAVKLWRDVAYEE